MQDDEYICFLKFKDGDERAFSQLFKRFRRPVFHLILTMIKDQQEAEDILLTSFLKLWQHRDRIENVVHLTRFVFKVARNKCLTALAQQNNEISVLDGIEIADNRTNQLFEDLLLDMWKQVDQLPDYMKTVVKMRVRDGLSYKDMSEKLNMKISTLYEYYKCAVLKLREFKKKQAL
jgi:RNA polymerase sigma factor (sigma-70 family)